MEDILFRFLELAERLEADPSVEVLATETYRGASEADFQYCEENAGVRISDDIREFYSLTNGLQLIWRFDDGRRFRFDRLDIVPGIKPKEFGPELTACINLGPIQDVFLKDWEEEIYFSEDRNRTMQVNGGQMSLWDFKRRFFPVDLYSNSSCAGFFALEKGDEPRVLIASDYYSSFRFSKPTGFRSYLEILLASAGRCGARNYLDGKGNYADPLISGDAAFWRKEMDKIGYATKGNR